MKKILFTLLMLCGMTAAWAEGLGDGTKERPFTGEWQISELKPKLKEGVYLAFDCVIKGTQINVTDIRLKRKIADDWTDWAPGNYIGDTVGNGYTQYGKDNSPANRKKQSFIVTYVYPTRTGLNMEGYFSGFYSNPDADGIVHVASAEQLWIILRGNSNVTANPRAKVKLSQDIYLSDMGEESKTFCSTFYGTLDGDGHTVYGDHYKENSTERRNRTYLFTYSDGATIKNLTFKNIRVDSRDHYNQAVITSQAFNGCFFENITLDQISTYTSYDNTGAAVGKAYGNCVFKNITVKNSDLTAKETQSGAVVGFAENCSFANIKVEHCQSTTNFDETAGLNGKSGGVAGRADSCAFENVEILGSFIKSLGTYVGGVVGYSIKSQYKNCTTDDQSCICADGSAINFYGTCYAGGIVGHSANDTIYNCINSALIAGDGRQLGGIVGRSEQGGLIEGCLNTGLVTSSEMDDVIESLYNRYKSKTDVIWVKTYQGKEYAIREFNVENTGYELLGGIAGYLLEGTVYRCANLGLVDTDGTVMGVPNVTDNNGGIVGGMHAGHIRDCLADFPYRANVQGICGRTYAESSINNCLNLTTGKDFAAFHNDWDGFTSDGNNYSLTSAEDAHHIKLTTKEKIQSGEICTLLGDNWEQNLGIDAYPTPTGNRGVYHARKISNQYGTVCFPFPVKSDDKITFYDFLYAPEEDDTSLRFIRVNSVEAGRPVLFRSAEAKDANEENPVEICFNNDADYDYDYDFTNPPKSKTKESSTMGSWQMVGTYAERVIQNAGARSTYYVSGGVIKNDSYMDIAPCSAYFRGSNIDTLPAAAANGLQIKIIGEDDMTTDLELVGNDLVPVQRDGKSYSLMGTQVGAGYRGIVIKNGKKYVR